MYRTFTLRALVHGLAVTIAQFALESREAPAQTREQLSNFEVALTYSPLLANVTTSKTFWMQGADAQIHGRVWRDLGIVGDVVGFHTGNVNDSHIGLDLFAYTAGPRYTWKPSRGRPSYFVQALGGAAHGANSIFPRGNQLDSSANSLAVQLGGGIDIPTSRHLVARPLEVNWLRTQLPNGTTECRTTLSSEQVLLTCSDLTTQ